MSTNIPRRGVLGAGLAGALGAALSGCAVPEQTDTTGAGHAPTEVPDPAHLAANVHDGLGEIPVQSWTYPAPGDNITLTHTQNFTMAAVIWDAASPVQPESVRIRLREKGSGWSDWMSMERIEIQDPSLTTTGTDPLTTNGADAVQIRVGRVKGANRGRIQNLRVVLSHTKLVEPPAMGTLASARVPAQEDQEGQTVATLASTVAAPMIYTRQMWGCVESQTKDFTRTVDVKGIAIHHTGSSNNYDGIAAECQQLRNIHYYHAVTLNWNDVAYSFIVGKSGTIYQGRRRSMEMPETGWHCLSMNHQSIGVSCLGNYSEAQPSAAMISSLVSTLAWLCQRYSLNPVGTSQLRSNYTGGTARYAAGTTFTTDTLFPHQAITRTSCPGTNIMSLLPSIRTRTAKQIQAARTPSISSTLPVWSVTTMSVHLRATADWAGTKLTTLATGTPVLRTGRASRGWREVVVGGRRGWVSMDWLKSDATVSGWAVLSTASALRTSASSTASKPYTHRAWGTVLVLRTSGSWSLVAAGGHLGWVLTSVLTNRAALTHHLSLRTATPALREPWATSSWQSVPAGVGMVTTRRESGGKIEVVLPGSGATGWVSRANVTAVIAR